MPRTRHVFPARVERTLKNNDNDFQVLQRLYRLYDMTSFRNIKGKDAVRAFVRAGGRVRQGRGDHVNIKMPGGELITIPVSGEVKIGLLKAAINSAGLSEEEFEKLL
jgi:predicted RNA binding protein YcfA (HicA-like mRNA interferase family)